MRALIVQETGPSTPWIAACHAVPETSAHYCAAHEPDEPRLDFRRADGSKVEHPLDDHRSGLTSVRGIKLCFTNLSPAAIEGAIRLHDRRPSWQNRRDMLETAIGGNGKASR
jgi:hypothetical protein